MQKFCAKRLQLYTKEMCQMSTKIQKEATEICFTEVVMVSTISIDRNQGKVMHRQFQ